MLILPKQKLNNPTSVRPKPLFWFSFGSGSIQKPKTKLGDTFGQYRNRYKTTFQGRIYLLTVWGIFSITKGSSKLNLLPILNIFRKERSGTHEKNLKLKVSVSEQKFGTDTEIGLWFSFPIPKPGFSRTLNPTDLINYRF